MTNFRPLLQPALAMLVPPPVSAHSAPPPAASDTPTCRGRPATLVGMPGERLAGAQLGKGTWIDKRQHTDIPGFEEASIAAGRTQLHGTAKRNHLVVFGCDSEIFGFRGNDELITVAGGFGNDLCRAERKQDCEP